MVADSKEYDLCGQVIGAEMRVHSALGPGFLEFSLSKCVDLGIAEVGNEG